MPEGVCGKKIFSALLIMVLLAMADITRGAERLPVIFSEEEEHQTEESWNYIDNQAYLEAYERSRYYHPPESVNRITLQGNSTGCGGRGLEYRSGSTVIIYYDGYRPNCCCPKNFIVIPSKGGREPGKKSPRRR